MRDPSTRLGAFTLWLLLFSPSAVSGQAEPHPCPEGPLRLALVFDQSLSTPIASTRNAYPAILSAFHSALRPSDRLVVFRLPGARENEVERIEEVTGERPVQANRIVGEILKYPTHDSDLAGAIRSIQKRFQDDPCRPAVVLITDGSLSPNKETSEDVSDDEVKLVVEEFRSAVREAQKSVDLYVLGFRGDARLAIDSTYWPQPRRVVRDDYWDVDLSTLRGDSLLRRTFSGRYFPYSSGAVTDLLLFSPNAVFPAALGYVTGLPSRREPAADLFLRAPLSNSTCHVLGLPDAFKGLREIGAAGDRCVFYHANPQQEPADWLDRYRMIEGISAIYQPARRYSFEGTSHSPAFRHGFIVRTASDSCSHRTLLTHLATTGRWPRSVPSGDRLYVAWNASHTADGSLVLNKDDSLVPVGTTGCLALDDLFTPKIMEGSTLWPVVFTDSMKYVQRFRIPVAPFRAYPASNFVLIRSFLKPGVWQLRGGVASQSQSKREARLMVRGFPVPLVWTEDRSCPEQRTPCFRVNTRISSAEAVNVGVLLLDDAELYDCGAEDCFPAPITARKPLQPFFIAAALCFLAAIGLEMMAVKLPYIRRFIAVKAWTHHLGLATAAVNILTTGAWLLLCCMISMDAVTPDANGPTALVQVALAFIGTGILLSFHQGVLDVASTYFMP
ncbi:MAG TPA: hypothetical protein VF647_11820 [Longimicrobium sp.]|jgi:hypothetical protein